jgi:hypothetical protein
MVKTKKTMKRHLLVILFSAYCFCAFSQTMSEVMEKRSKEMVRVIGLDNKEEWKKFIKENFAQSLIDKQMRANVDTGDGRAASSSTPAPADKVEAKAKMFGQLHQDFGKAKITSLKPAGEKMNVSIEGEEGMAGVISLVFDKVSPYMITGLGIEVGGNR